MEANVGSYGSCECDQEVLECSAWVDWDALWAAKAIGLEGGAYVDWLFYPEPRRELQASLAA